MGVSIEAVACLASKRRHTLIHQESTTARDVALKVTLLGLWALGLGIPILHGAGELGFCVFFVVFGGVLTEKKDQKQQEAGSNHCKSTKTLSKDRSKPQTLLSNHKKTISRSRF